MDCYVVTQRPQNFDNLCLAWTELLAWRFELDEQWLAVWYQKDPVWPTVLPHLLVWYA